METEKDMNLVVKNRFGDWFSEGFKLFGSEWGTWVLTVLIFFLIVTSAACIFLIPLLFVLMPLICGMYDMAFKQMRGETITMGMMFKGFEVMGPAVIFSLAWLAVGLVPAIFYVPPFVAAIVLGGSVAKIGTGIILALGIIFHIIIVIYMAVRMTFVPMLLMEKRMSFVEALRLSFSTTRGAFWWMFLLRIVFNIVQNAGAYVLYIGLLATFPAGLLMYALAYEDCIGTDKEVIEPGVVV